MSKKRIHINESQLYGLIRQTINEISTQTKMSAANKAAREADKHWAERDDPNNPNQVLARNMWDKRFKQQQAFRDAVNQEMDELPFTANTSFWPHTENSRFYPRGDMNTYTKRIHFGDTGKYIYDFPDDDDERDKKFNDVEQFLNGNSYYEKGRGWVNPDDEGYDMEKSEPWARIRKKNESIARRVTENIIREIKRNSKPIKKA